MTLRPSLLILLAAIPRLAAANPLDLYGLGARGPALAGAYSALASDASAAYYNPAGLATGDRTTFLLGYSAGVPRLEFDGRRAPAETARGVTLGLAIPRKVGSGTVAFGVALYFPDQRIVRVSTAPASQPRFALFDNRLHRIAVHPALAWRPVPWLSLGAGISILSDAKGAGTDFDVGLDLDRPGDPTAHQATAALDVQLPTRMAPVLGLWARPHRDLRLALTYRGSISLDVELESRVNIDAGLLQGRAVTGLASSDYFSPDQLALGVAWDVTSRVTVSAEATWMRWSAAPPTLPRITALVELGLPIDVIQVSLPTRGGQPWDIVTTRVGVEARSRPRPWLGLDVRAGAAYEPSPYPRQTGVPSLADNDRFVLAAGAGLVFRRLGKVLRGPVRLDVHFQAHLLRGRLHPKDDPLGPVPTFASGGAAYVAGAAVQVGF